ncbi:MAG: thymidine kinase [Proteobacteria bacterium]|nr:thymidine kinase [Pseudomonadota bacterium]
MAKLYFRYGAMGSAKTLNLLAVAHNYEAQGKHVYLIKPLLDDRFGACAIRSRAGLSRDADLCVGPHSEIDLKVLEGIDCVLVDECQFLSEKLVHQLRNITTDLDIPVICYGLRTNFKTRLFEGSKRLLEVADTIEEIKTTCAFCNRKAVFNIKLRNGEACSSGAEIELGTENLYQPVCCRCYEARIGSANPLRKDSVEIWFVRHGQTEANEKGILSGWINAQLTPKGIAQADALKPILEKEDFDGVYSSDLDRAIETARHAWGEPVQTASLREIFFGDYDGKPIREVDPEWVKKLYIYPDGFSSPNGETLEDVSKRITAFLDNLKPGRYLIVCHGGVIRTVSRQIGEDRFIENGTVLVMDWSHKKILRSIQS